MAAAPRPVVLVHGAWHGAWCWAALQAELDRRGIASYAVDLPGHGVSTEPLSDLLTDARHVVDVLAGRALAGDRCPHGVVLVGHSYGGAVISEAAVHATNIDHLVFLTAFVLGEGESLMSYLSTLPRVDTALGAAMQMLENGTSVLDPQLAVEALYALCDPGVVPAAIARLGPQPMATFVQPVTGTSSGTVPSTYVRCLQDQAIAIEHQDVMSQRCAMVVTLDTDHSPFLSKITETADILERIARA
jgi:pimeloyl-ACP methyl ester carboxylesterase